MSGDSLRVCRDGIEQPAGEGLPRRLRWDRSRPEHPANTAPPKVSGTADQGQTLTASTGTWSPAATAYAYQWQRSTDGGNTWADIAGATGATYSLGAGDGNADERVVVTASNSSGQASATSASVGPVTSEAPVNVTAPSVTGTTTQGQSLATDPGTWSPAATAYSYQWQRSMDGTTWSDIAGATSATYLLGTADIGAQVRVLVTASNQYGTSTGATAASAVGPVVSGAPSNTALPAISGTAEQGLTLTASPGAWNPAGTSYAYQWQRSTDGGNTWVNIAGATLSSYTLAPADENAEIRIAVTAVNPYGEATTQSAATKPVKASPPTTASAATVRIAGATTVTNRGWPVASRHRPLRTAGTRAR